MEELQRVAAMTLQVVALVVEQVVELQRVAAMILYLTLLLAQFLVPPHLQ